MINLIIINERSILNWNLMSSYKCTLEFISITFISYHWFLETVSSMKFSSGVSKSVYRDIILLEVNYYYYL